MRNEEREVMGAMTPLPRRAPRIERGAIWLLAVMAVSWAVWAGLAGSGETAGEVSRGTSLTLSVLCFGLAVMLGIRGAQRRARAHDAAARVAARMLMVAELGQQDDATLERMAGNPGAAGDAARTILQGRHLGNPAGTPRHSKPESP